MSKGGIIFFLEDSKSIFKYKNKPKNKNFVVIKNLRKITDHLSEYEPYKISTKIASFAKSKKAILMCGLPGVGKSTLAKDLEKIANYERISSNKIRLKELFPEDSRYGGNYGKQNQFKKREDVCKRMNSLALKLLEKGKKVILDGTYMDELRNVAISFLLKHLKSDEIMIVVVKTDKEIVEERYTNDNNKDIDKLLLLLNAWTKDTLAGKFWYPKPSDYPSVDILEIENGNEVRSIHPKSFPQN